MPRLHRIRGWYCASEEYWSGQGHLGALDDVPIPRTYKLEQTGYDPIVRTPAQSEMEAKIGQAVQKSFEFGDRTPVGVFYQNEHIPTYEERLAHRTPAYGDSPPAKQDVGLPDGTPLADVSRLLDEFRVT